MEILFLSYSLRQLLHASKASRLSSESKQPTTIGSPVWVSQLPPSFVYVVVEFTAPETSEGIQNSHMHCTICEDVTVQLFTLFDENTPPYVFSQTSLLFAGKGLGLLHVASAQADPAAAARAREQPKVSNVRFMVKSPIYDCSLIEQTEIA